MRETPEKNPAFISNRTLAFINLYNRGTDTFAEIAHCDDITEASFMRPIQFHKDAKNFLDMLEDLWTPAFLIALRSAITDKLQEHDKEYGTKFAEKELDK